MAQGGHNPVLSKLREQSAGLCRLAVAGTGDSTAPSKVEVDVLLRLREQLKQQKSDLQNRISTGEISVDELSLEYITEETLNEAIKQLVLETENVKVSYHNKSLLLQRMQIFYSIQNKILEKNADSELLKKNINHSMDIASLILREQKESRAMEKRLIEIKEKRMVLKEKSTALMSELQSIVDELRLQNEPKEQKLKKIYGYVQKEMDATFILQNIFQRLVHASQVNWVEDPKLRDAVIKAGKNLLCF